MSDRPSFDKLRMSGMLRRLVGQGVAGGQHFDPGLAAVEGDLVAGSVEEANARVGVRLGPGAGDGYAVQEDDGFAAAGGLAQQVRGGVAGAADRRDDNGDGSGLD